eukprot:5602950-Amphidinium_carterae.1
MHAIQLYTIILFHAFGICMGRKSFVFRDNMCKKGAYIPDELKPAASFKDQIAELETSLVPLFFFCLVWSLGGSCNASTRIIALLSCLHPIGVSSAMHRPAFSQYIWGAVDATLREGMEQQLAEGHTPLPELQEKFVTDGLEPGCLLYDYFYSIEEKRWIPWMQTVPNLNLVSSPLARSRTKGPSALRLWVQLLRCCAGPGPTGTGKSANIALWLQKQAPENFQATFINFSAQTHVNQLQDLIDSKLEKRRRGVFGPPAGAAVHREAQNLDDVFV